jgi:capsular polysaccharide transport system permease protein
MLSLLDRALGLRDHFQSRDADIFSRLPGSASREDLLSYYQDHISVDFDEKSSILVVQAQAFTPDFSEKLVRYILLHSEAFINEIGHRLAGEHLNFIKEELDRSREQLRIVKQDVMSFQDQHQMISPEEQTRSVSSIVSEMEAEIAREEAHLKGLNGYLNKIAPDVVSSTNRIKALQEQITTERNRLAGRNTGALNSLNSRFQGLNIDLEFAVDAYQASMVALANARVEASKKLKHLVVITTPSMAEDSMYPRRLYILSTLLMALLMSYWLCSMILATINEHR